MCQRLCFVALQGRRRFLAVNVANDRCSSRCGLHLGLLPCVPKFPVCKQTYMDFAAAVSTSVVQEAAGLLGYYMQLFWGWRSVSPFLHYANRRRQC